MISVSLDKVYAVSEDVVARTVAGELVVIPLTSGVGDMEDDLFSLNETAKAILSHLDGSHSLRQVVQLLSDEYEATDGAIETDVLGMTQELFNRRIVVENI